MRILQFRAQNIKRLVVVEITPDGNIIQISGKNGAGKTSVLDAIWWALEGVKAIQAQPIREGQDKASVELDFGEIVVERTWRGQNSYLKVTNADGMAFSSPQTVLDGLIGKLSFDPLAFQRMKGSEQIVMLQDLAGVDGSAVAESNKVDFEARTEVNRDAKKAEAAAEQIVFPPDTPADETDLSELREKIEAQSSTNNSIKAAIDRQTELSSRIKKGKELIKALEDEFDSLNELADTETTDTAAMSTEFNLAVTMNENARKRGERDQHLATVETLKAKSAELTEAMKKRTEDFQAQIAAADLPIDGLGLDLELGVMFDGHPFDQASNAEQIRISTALAMTANPTIRVLRIREGSLLDADSLAMISDMADAEDYQVWIEVVESGSDSAIILKDGMIANASEDQEGE